MPFLFQLFFLLLLAGCSKGSESGFIDEIPPMEESPVQEPPKSLKYLALGDSYTIGHGVPAQERFPVQLQDSLKARGIPMDSVRIIARTGWTTDELMRAIDLEKPGSDYDLVTLLIGVNNQYRGYPMLQYRIEFEALINQAIAFAQNDTANVVVISIPDYAYTPFGQRNNPQKISKDLDLYNQANRSIAGLKKVKYVHITDISREGLNDPSLVAPDNLHPSGKMYRHWVIRMMPEVLQALSAP